MHGGNKQLRKLKTKMKNKKETNKKTSVGFLDHAFKNIPFFPYNYYLKNKGKYPCYRWSGQRNVTEIFKDVFCSHRFLSSLLCFSSGPQPSGLCTHRKETLQSGEVNFRVTSQSRSPASHTAGTWESKERAHHVHFCLCAQDLPTWEVPHSTASICIFSLIAPSFSSGHCFINVTNFSPRSILLDLILLDIMGVS